MSSHERKYGEAGTPLNTISCDQLEIIIDLPFGFPINNIISRWGWHAPQYYLMRSSSPGDSAPESLARCSMAGASGFFQADLIHT